MHGARLVVLSSAALALLVGTSSAQHAGHAPPPPEATTSGKIPITSRSPEAIAHFLEARALQEALTPHEAHLHYARALALDPAFALAAYGLGATAPTPRAAREHLAHAASLAAAGSEGERLLIRALQARLDEGPAAWGAVAESLVALHPGDERAQWMLGSARSAQGQYAAAIRSYRRALAIAPTFALAWNSIGYAERNAGNAVAAEDAFRQYIALVPDDPNPYDSYGELLLTLGRFDEAISQYGRAQAIDPIFPGSFVGIASAHALAGRHLEARAEAMRYLEGARDAHERRAALNTLALVEADEGDAEAALAAITRMQAVAASEGDTASMVQDILLQGELHVLFGRLDEAEAAFRDADLLAAGSSLSPTQQVEVGAVTHYGRALVALERGAADLVAAAVVALGATDGSVSRARELKGRLALRDAAFARAVGELEAADGSDPMVLVLQARAHRGQGHEAVARRIEASVLGIHRLLDWPLVRARIALGQPPR
ncbi:MAG: tetratricopeptide repeat protein [Gemmatimonadales bacterium]